MATSQYVIAFITTASVEEAGKIARTLVEEQLAACCNIINPITSVYRWEGDVVEDSETLIIAKTRKSLMKSLISRVGEIHSYEVPEIISVQLSEGAASYLKWLGESTRENGKN
jgi:periplasmic divalent cation tolerance protein